MKVYIWLQMKDSATDTILRFWRKVDKPTNADACWLWTGSTDKDGYGSMLVDSRPTNVSRFSMVLHGIPLSGNFLVRHRCGNKLCINPVHLFTATRAQQYDDLPRRKGKSYEKLDAEKVREIRSSSLPSRDLAEKYGVSQCTISATRNRRAWAHVQDVQ